MNGTNNGRHRRPPLSTEALGHAAFVVAVLALAGGVAGIVLGSEAAMGIGFALALIAFVLGGAMLLANRHERRCVDAMVSGDRFVHWTYGESDWTRQVDAEQRRLAERPLLFGLLFGAVVGILGCTLVAVVNACSSKKLSHEDLFVGLGLIMAISMVIGTVLGGSFALKAFVRHRLLRRSGGEVYIGPPGLYYGGEFWPSHGGNPRFRRLSLDAGPPSALVFVFNVRAPRGGAHDKDLHIPIPAGRNAEAQNAVEQVRATWQSPS